MAERLARLRLALRAGREVDARLSRTLLAATVATNLTMVLRALWFKLIIDAALAGDRSAAVRWGIGLAVSEGLRSWTLLVGQMSRMDLEAKAAHHFHHRLMELVARPPEIGHLERQEVLDRIDAVRGQLGALGSALALVVDGIATIVRAITALVLLATVSPVLVLLPLFALPTLTAARRAEKAVQDANVDQAPIQRRAEHLYGLLTQPGPGKEVRLAGVRAELVRREAEQWSAAARVYLRGLARGLRIRWLGWAIFYLGVVGAVVLVVAEVAAGRANPGDLFLTVTLANQVNGQVVAGAALIGSLSRALRALESLDWLERSVSETVCPTDGTRLAPDRLERGIVLKDVGFRYAGAEHPTLTGVDLTLPAGAVIALVGDNGAGKSTVVKLLTGLHHPTEGRVLIDGTDLRDLDPSSWRARLGVGFQDHVRFELVLQEAVGVGDLAAVDDRVAVAESLERASAADLVEALPNGLDTKLGVGFGGVDLSGGQWQKVAIARAFMRRTPLLLALDEPAAALDPDSEYRLFRRFAAAARETSVDRGVTVLVSHRFSTVRMADLIVVLERGRVVEVGSHDELLAADGAYAEMFHLQAAGYRP